MSRQTLYCVPSYTSDRGRIYWWRLVDVSLNVLIMGPFLDSLKEKFPHCDFEEVTYDWHDEHVQEHIRLLVCTHDDHEDIG